MNQENNLPIGLFDSGVGGLTVLSAMMRRMPNEQYVFLGDTARLPYGSKSSKTIVRYAVQAADLLLSQQIKMLVIACNTATAAALPVLQKNCPHIPVIGVIRPGARAACAASQNGRIGVIATASTIASGAYREAILELRPEAEVIGIPCPLFVPLAEEGWLDGPIAEAVAARYLEPLKSLHPDTLLLGCTHYPLLIRAIRTAVAPEMHIVDSAATTAEAAYARLEASSLLRNTAGRGHVRYFTTDDPAQFIRTGNLFLGTAIRKEDVSHVDL